MPDDQETPVPQEDDELQGAAIEPSGQAAEPEEDDESGPKAEDVIPAQVLNALPPQQRRELLSTFTALIQGPLPSPIAKQVKAHHIDAVIDLQRHQADLEFEDRKDSRRFVSLFIGIVATLASVVVIVLALNNKDDLLAALIQVGSGAVGGFGGGYAFQAWRAGRYH